MQSAFVDIGLERDAFLYVSDFMELEDSEDLDEVPTNRPVPERYQAQSHGEEHAEEAATLPAAEPQTQEHESTEAGQTEHHESSAPGERETRDGMRGRRRRRIPSRVSRSPGAEDS